MCEKEIPCPICLEPLKLLRLNPQRFLKSLRKLLDLCEATNGADSIKHRWSWVDGPGRRGSSVNGGSKAGQPRTSTREFDCELFMVLTIITCITVNLDVDLAV